jgi:hypothetical protein
MKIYTKKKNINKKTFRKIEFFEKLYNIVVYTDASPSRTKEFKDLVEKIIAFDNNIRWNSWYQMLKIIIEKIAVIDNYICKNWTLSDHLLGQEVCLSVKSFDDRLLGQGVLQLVKSFVGIVSLWKPV